MRISDWSSDVCSSDLPYDRNGVDRISARYGVRSSRAGALSRTQAACAGKGDRLCFAGPSSSRLSRWLQHFWDLAASPAFRWEENTSELQSLMRISYAVFWLKKKNRRNRDEILNRPTPR